MTNLRRPLTLACTYFPCKFSWKSEFKTRLQNMMYIESAAIQLCFRTRLVVHFLALNREPSASRASPVEETRSRSKNANTNKRAIAALTISPEWSASAELIKGFASSTDIPFMKVTPAQIYEVKGNKITP